MDTNQEQHSIETNGQSSFTRIHDLVNGLQEPIESVANAIHQQKGTVKTAFTIFFLSALLPCVHFFGIFHLHIVIIVFSWLISFFFLISWFGLLGQANSYKFELERLEQRKKLYLQLLNVDDNETYFNNLVKINVENLGEYYALVKAHSQKSFFFTSAVSFIGFLLIVIGLGMGFFDVKNVSISYLSASTGILVELISGVFFYLYNKTVRQLKDYHDSLLDVQNILLSFKLIESTEESQERASMINKMIEFLVGRK